MSTTLRQVRPPYRVMFSAIRALIIREINKKFIISVNTKRSMGVIWLFWEPLLHVLMWGGIRMFYHVETSYGLDPHVFVLLGVVPFIFTRGILSSSAKCIQSNKGLLSFRQIVPIDIIISIWMSQILIIINVTIFLFSLCYWLDVPFKIYDPFTVLSFLACFFIFMLGVNIILSVLGFFFTLFNNFVMFLQRALYFFSGVFFPAESIPYTVRPYFLANPLFQTVEALREGFAPLHEGYLYCDLTYMVTISLLTFFVGLGMYFFLRKQIMMKIEERS